jgi:hypothetical protein
MGERDESYTPDSEIARILAVFHEGESCLGDAGTNLARLTAHQLTMSREIGVCRGRA